ncbi:MAG: hypothetical protein WD894_13395 [Pirellulales bacterium]
MLCAILSNLGRAAKNQKPSAALGDAVNGGEHRALAVAVVSGVGDARDRIRADDEGGVGKDARFFLESRRSGEPERFVFPELLGAVAQL